jgi:hypothetical protein
MKAVVGSSFMAMASEEQGDYRGHFIEFLVNLPLLVRVWDETRAPARLDHGEDQPLKPEKFIMRRQSDQQPEPSATQRLWTYEAALRAIPYPPSCPKN